MTRLLLAALLFVTAPIVAQERATAWNGTGADGKPVTFDPAHRDKPAILLFWATWCPYCEALMPHLQNVYDEATPQKLDVFAIDIKDDGDPVGALRKRHQTFTLVRDGDAIADQYKVKGTPGVFLVDAQGNVIYHADTSDPQKIESALREKLHLPPKT